MSDASVAEALRSELELVVVEAPAGCGKTYQAAEYAKWLADRLLRGKVLILTHTHSACDVFRGRTEGCKRRVHVTTIDGLVVQISGMYHQALGLPRDTSAWAFEQGRDGFEQLAQKVCGLLAASPAITAAIVASHPFVLCDEHQDANAAQHEVVMKLRLAGARVRVFGDPMQAIYVTGRARAEHEARWARLIDEAERFEVLDHPHRWADGSPELGQWVLGARETLRNGGAIDLSSGLPTGLTLISADNIAERRGGFRLTEEMARRVNRVVNGAGPMMILATQNDTVRGVNGFLGGRLPIWEGHTRDALQGYVRACEAGVGDASAIAEALRTFIQTATKGFSDSAFANRFIREVTTGAVNRCTGMPAQLQGMARLVINSPDHRGAAQVLAMLQSLSAENSAFRDMRVDLVREYRDAIKLRDYDNVREGLTELTRRRSVVRTSMPARFISTVHKAKGLEGPSAILMPCDSTHFPGSADKRCLLYVALSRASSSLTIVASAANASPLFVLP